MQPFWPSEAHHTCTECALHKDRQQVVPGMLGKHYDGVFLLGEAPGPQEDREGVPWIGPAGDYLMDLLERNGLHREMLYMGNVAKCWPHVSYQDRGRTRTKTKPPKLTEMRACVDVWLLEELRAHKPHTIITLGGNAVKPFMKKAIGQIHGRAFEIDIEGYGKVKLIPLYHPSAKLHNEAMEVPIEEDFARLPDLLGMKAEDPTDKEASYVWIRRHDSIEPILEALRQPLISIDSETYMEQDITVKGGALHPSHVRLLGMSVSTAPGNGYYVDGWHPEIDRVVLATKLALHNPTQVKIIWNAGYDLEVFHSPGAVRVYDGMLMAYVLGWPKLKLEECVGSILRLNKVDLKEHMANENDRQFKLGVRAMSKLVEKAGLEDRKFLKKDQVVRHPKIKRIQYLPAPLRAFYGAEDTDMALRLTQIATARLQDDPDLWRIFSEIEMPMVPDVMEMTRVGMGVDHEVLDDIEREIAPRIEQADAKCQTAVGKEGLAWLETKSQAAAKAHWFNPGSSEQLGMLLYDYFKLPVVHRSKETGAPSSDELAIAELSETHPEYDGLWEPLLLRRELTKIQSTYIVGIRKRICRHCGRLHTNLKQFGADTGRMASADPNLQNIPTQRSLGRRVREALTV